MIRLPKRKPRKTTETDIVGKIRVALGELPYVTVWRNNTGAYRNESGRLVKYGLCVGSSDLIGLVSTDLRDMGPCYEYTHIGRFFAIEVKKPGEEPTEDQQLYLDVVRQQGGAAGWADCVDGALEFIEKARRLEV